MSDLYEILEICLQEVGNGADLESVLSHYPAHARELRPILETAVKAIKVGGPDPSSEVIRRNRARVLQHAAQIRESQVQTKARRLWTVPLRRALVTLIVIGVLFITSTKLVSAASTTLPGDNLYPVKRTWEDVLLLFTFNTQSREALEVEHENERLHELNELFAQGRSVRVDFSGLVTRQNANLWLVSGIPVAVSSQTNLPTQPIVVGSAIHVVGVTQNDGAVLAQQIELLPAGVPLPEVNDDDSFELEQDHSGDSSQSVEDNSGEGSEETPTSEPESNSGSSSEIEHKDESVQGTVESINGNIVTVNGQIMNVSSAEVEGSPRVGSKAEVEGYYDANGLFIVTKIHFESSGSDGESISTDSGSHDGGADNSTGSGGDGSDDHPDDSSGSGGDDH